MRYSYLAILVVIIFLSFAAYLVFRPRGPNQDIPALNPETKPEPQRSVPTPLDSRTIPAGEKIELGTPHGTVTVNNFYKIAEGWDGNESSGIIIRSTAKYRIIYDAASSAFVIYIIGGPVESARKSAEGDLLNILGIPPAQVCYLNAYWSVSPFADDNLSGKTYPLSFCSSGL